MPHRDKHSALAGRLFDHLLTARECRPDAEQLGMARSLLSQFDHLVMARKLLSKIAAVEETVGHVRDPGHNAPHLEFTTYDAGPEQVRVALVASHIPEYLFANASISCGRLTVQGGVVWDVISLEGIPLLRLTAAARCIGKRTCIDVDVRPSCGPHWNLARRALIDHPQIGTTCRLLVTEHADALLTNRSFNPANIRDAVAGK